MFATLTVLFCDLVNSTGLAAQRDPEEWREILVNYYGCAAHEIDASADISPSVWATGLWPISDGPKPTMAVQWAAEPGTVVVTDAAHRLILGAVCGR